MTAKWPEVALGEVLRPVSRGVPLDPVGTYNLLGAHWYAKGLYVKDCKTGAEIKAKTLFRVETGDFVYNRLFAWKGAFAIATRADDGCFVSNEFPCFTVVLARLEPQFLLYYLSQEKTWNEALGLSYGATPTSRNRLKEGHLLSMTIPLPPLAEQQRIVAKIEHLAAKVEEARRLCERAAAQSELLLASYVGRVFSRLELKHGPKTLSVFSPHVTSGPRNWGKHYEPHGLRFYRAQDVGTNGHVLEGAKVFVAPPPGEQGRSAVLECGDLMLVITGATVGRVSMFREGLEHGLVSQHVAICRLPATQVDPEYALWGLRGPQGQAQLLSQRYGQGKPGLNLSNVRALSLPFPPVAEQRRTATLLTEFEGKVRNLTGQRARTCMKLDATMPAILDQAFRGEL